MPAPARLPLPTLPATAAARAQTALDANAARAAARTLTPPSLPTNASPNAAAILQRNAGVAPGRARRGFGMALR